uniref:Uncharacterized protein n=1 Tax=Anopheles merus TaxID=30066 RepID=A0A182V5P7_ANOME
MNQLIGTVRTRCGLFSAIYQPMFSSYRQPPAASIACGDRSVPAEPPASSYCTSGRAPGPCVRFDTFGSFTCGHTLQHAFLSGRYGCQVVPASWNSSPRLQPRPLLLAGAGGAAAGGAGAAATFGAVTKKKEES